MDASKRSQFAMLYKILHNGEPAVVYADMIALDRGTAVFCRDAILTMLERDEIELDRVLGMAADTCSVNFGQCNRKMISFS